MGWGMGSVHRGTKKTDFSLIAACPSTDSIANSILCEPAMAEP
jgi:hypothetical protein